MGEISDGRKSKIGRPPVGAVPVTVRIPPANLKPLDAWIAAQPDPKPSRPEAIRRLIEVGLAPGDALSRLYRNTLQSSLEESEQYPADENERDWAVLYRDLIANTPSADELQEWFVQAINERVERLAHDRERSAHAREKAKKGKDRKSA